MGANDDQVDLELFSGLVNLSFGRAKNEMPAMFFNAKFASEVGEMRRRLIMNLILNGRQVDGDFAAVAQAEWLNHMNDVQFGMAGIGDEARAPGYPSRIFGEVGRKKNSLDLGHSPYHP